MSEYEKEKKLVIEAMLKLYKMEGTYSHIYDHVIGKMDEATFSKVLQLLKNDYLIFEKFGNYRLSDAAAKRFGLTEQLAIAKEQSSYKPKEVDYDDFEYTVVNPDTGAVTTAVGRKYHDKRNRPSIFNREFFWIWGIVCAFIIIAVIIVVLITAL